MSYDRNMWKRVSLYMLCIVYMVRQASAARYYIAIYYRALHMNICNCNVLYTILQRNIRCDAAEDG